MKCYMYYNIKIEPCQKLRFKLTLTIQSILKVKVQNQKEHMYTYLYQPEKLCKNNNMAKKVTQRRPLIKDNLPLHGDI